MSMALDGNDMGAAHDTALALAALWPDAPDAEAALLAGEHAAADALVRRAREGTAAGA